MTGTLISKCIRSCVLSCGWSSFPRVVAGVQRCFLLPHFHEKCRLSVPLASFCPTFCTWCLLQEGSDFHGISTEPCCESGWTGELIRNIRKTGRKTKKKENCWRLLYCNISPQGSKQEMLVPVSISKANLSSLKRQIFTEVCKHASLSSPTPAFFPFLSHS